ncbi:MAG: peptidoglycan-binding protein, partial [Patescibacteria group bacterium]
MKPPKKNIFIIAIFFILFAPLGVNAVNFGDNVNFYIDSNYDASARSQITATLVKTTSNFYFYVEKSWWDSQMPAKQNEILLGLDVLSLEFSNKIYPTLTSVFGSEWKPGVDGDAKITILFHLMKEGAGGYFRSADEYLKLQLSDSNEREMLYLPIGQIDSSEMKIFLAHEFMHLITFNQKNKIFDVEEEVWLNEARADYSSNILGYDIFYSGSNLEKRVKTFLEKPTDSLTEWQENKYDYGVANLFIYYLNDHYGINILIDSLKSKFVGINSINYALQKNGIEENFSQIFTNWTIASVINDCFLDMKYCYLNTNLKNFRLNPTLNFLPLSGNSSLSVTNVTKNWAGNWQKVIGGNGDLKLNFSSIAGLNFQAPYIVFDKNNSYSIKFLKLDKKEQGEINLKNFGADYNSLIIIPSLQTKLEGFDGLELTYPYTFTVSIAGQAPIEDQVLIQKLLDQIASLKKQIADIIAQKNGGNNNIGVCSQLNNDLSFGMSNNNVSCLQSFLKSQGVDIYPEGLVTGNFGSLTRLAVIRFQEKYKSEILAPLGLSAGTGFVGPATRAKINQL